MNYFKFKINGSSIRNEFITCISCKKKFSWLKAKEVSAGNYIAQCRECRIKK